ncbi:branched-chain amino acid ABC transporter permease [Solirubrobacter phytolaccae]|uniref:Branched-chain amino acid ABC transporter permease n=1 Tax=Solirubrobacter phytolaccae TaxID=1404360 RepID=A0A9X3N4L4_9ACTN|nr:branched-chain amino acid ABC transporter permease [Solirubrobacter phytolaccae]MDA0179648.1 branched-chain amino acid ABC transporter permease [Solirubrobacter phytolaccae]
MSRRLAIYAVVIVALAAVPIWFESFWLQTGLFAMAAIIAAIGLTILVGIAGQLSLAHAFFVAVGAYGYAYLADKIPPLLAVVAAVLLAGLAGALFSPIAGRVRGIYLGLASLGLVFLGQHILQNATGITGGYRGIAVPPFSVLGFEFTGADGMVVLGVPYGPLEKLWYLGLVLVAVSLWYGRNLVRSRPGRALATVRDSEVAAATNGIDVVRYKAAAFTVSSMYAGLGGVLMALAFGRIVPESFGFLLSVDFLVMVVIGGAGSVGGAAAGAVFVTALPLILNHYSGSLPLLAEPGSGGVGAAELSRLLYGAAIVAVLLFARDGLAGLVHRKERVV